MINFIDTLPKWYVDRIKSYVDVKWRWVDIDTSEQSNECAANREETSND